MPTSQRCICFHPAAESSVACISISRWQASIRTHPSPLPPQPIQAHRLLLLAAGMRLLKVAGVCSSIVRLSAAFLPAAVLPQAARTAAAGSAALRATTPTVVEGDAEAFERITLARRATKHFDRRAVPDDVLKKVMLHPTAGASSDSSP